MRNEGGDGRGREMREIAVSQEIESKRDEAEHILV